MQKYISVGISFPRKLLEQIDNDRKDVPRSKYLFRILERSYIERNKDMNSLDAGFARLVSSESFYKAR